MPYIRRTEAVSQADQTPLLQWRFELATNLAGQVV
jgi:hypothetical protein